MRFQKLLNWLKEGILSFLLLFLFLKGVFSQDITFAKNIVDTLTSNYYHGRGYVDYGDLEASRFIGNFFEEHHLKTFSEKGYYQKFNFPVNQFSGRMILATGKNELLEPGKDFLIDPASPGGTFKRPAFHLNKDTYLNNPYLSDNHLPSFFDSLIVISNDAGIISEDSLKSFHLIENFISERAATIKVQKNKLTWSVSREILKHPKFYVKPGLLSSVDSVEVVVDQQLLKNHESQNVVGYIEGEKTENYIVITGHYDHLGEMGQGIIFPGANDNASGIAMILDLITHFTQIKPKYSVVFIAFGGEEAGLVGSKYFVDHPLFPLDKIKFLINLDLMGSGEDGITVVNGALHEKAYKKLLKINKKKNYVIEIKKRGKAANSDHYWFSENGVPAFFIYARGKSKAYHDIYDTPETLTYAGYNGIFKLIADFINRL